MDKVFYVLAAVAVLLAVRLVCQRQLMSALADILLLSLTLIVLTISLGAPMAGVVTLVLYCTGMLLAIFVACVSIQTLSPVRFQRLSVGLSGTAANKGMGQVAGKVSRDSDTEQHAMTKRTWLLPAILAAILLLCMWWLIGSAQLGEVTQGVTAQTVSQQVDTAYVLLGQITLLWLVISLCWLYQCLRYVQCQLHSKQSLGSDAAAPLDAIVANASTSSASDDTANKEASS